MSLDFYLTEVRPTTVASFNITHNLNRMAEAAGIYKCLWRPDENGISKAHQVIEPLAAGLAELLANPSKYKAYDAENGWGTYENFVDFVKDVLSACIENPNADVEVSR